MSTKGSAANLVEAVKVLSNQWQLTLDYWHDVKSQEFERTYLAELPGHVSRVTAVMDEIDKLLKKVRNDCE
jgi:hypothetical protein